MITWCSTPCWKLPRGSFRKPPRSRRSSRRLGRAGVWGDSLLPAVVLLAAEAAAAAAAAAAFHHCCCCWLLTLSAVAACPVQPWQLQQEYALLCCCTLPAAIIQLHFVSCILSPLSMVLRGLQVGLPKSMVDCWAPLGVGVLSAQAVLCDVMFTQQLFCCC